MPRELVALLLICSMSLAQIRPALAQGSVAPSAPPPAAPASSAISTLSDCAEMGRYNGRRVPTGGPFAIGIASGVVLGPVGAAVAWAFQGEPEATPQQAHLASSAIGDPTCWLAYANAFGKEGKKKKRAAALMGGLIGTVVLVTLIYGANGGSSNASY